MYVNSGDLAFLKPNRWGYGRLVSEGNANSCSNTRHTPRERRTWIHFILNFSGLLWCLCGVGRNRGGGSSSHTTACVELRWPQLHGVSSLLLSSPGFWGSDPDHRDLVASAFTVWAILPVLDILFSLTLPISIHCICFKDSMKSQEKWHCKFHRLRDTEPYKPTVYKANESLFPRDHSFWSLCSVFFL